MPKVITISRVFPSYHSKKGQPTYFVEKIWKSLVEKSQPYSFSPSYLSPYEKEYEKHYPYTYSTPLENIHNHNGKHHTIRLGKRWKTGDKASIRVWGDDVNPKSGRKGAYHSKQIIIAPDVEVTVYNVELWKQGSDCFIGQKVNENTHTLLSFGEVARNDGLDFDDMKEWFRLKEGVTIEAQIICWNNDLKY